MKVILSRKGFDGGFGGFPSPIFPDGRMVSLPIPEEHSPLTYFDVNFSADCSLAVVMKQLFGRHISHERLGKLDISSTGCHLDPDIDPLMLNRSPEWQGLFGQDGTAQAHLSNQNIRPGDIFLFFGWFRKVELNSGRYSYSTEDKGGSHVLYGYLEVGDILPLSQAETSVWMQYHPHITTRLQRKTNNTLYVARKQSSILPGISGSGIFKYNQNLTLTKKGCSRSKWQLPTFFKELTVSYHSEKSWKGEYFQSAAKGQEFVVQEDSRVMDWVKNILLTGSR